MRDRPPIVRSVRKLLLVGRCTDLVRWLAHVQRYTVLPTPTLPLGQMLPVFYTVSGGIVYCATPPTLLLGQMLPVFYTVGGAILHCAIPPYTTVGADAARFFNGWRRDPLLCYPPPLLLEQMLAVIYIYTVGCAILYCATPSPPLLGDLFLFYPPTLHLRSMLPVLVR